MNQLGFFEGDQTEQSGMDPPRIRVFKATEIEFRSVPYQHHSPTSKAAAHEIKPCAATLRAKVLGAIQDSGIHGMTDIECQAETGMDGSTQRPRRIELQRAGLIRESGKRETPSGRLAVVWVAV